MNEKDMIKVIDARLHYLFSSPEKYNIEEVNALLNLLKEYDSDALNGGQAIHITEELYQSPETITALISATAYIAILSIISLLEPD